jgi:hypothetical protein
VVRPCWLYWHCGSKCCGWCRWYLRIPILCLFHSFLGHSGISFSLEYLSLARVIMFNVHGSVHRKYILIYIQQDAMLHSLFISGNCSSCFGWYHHPSSGAHTTVSTASGTCQTVIATCRYRGGVGTGLSVLWVVYTLPTASWWWVEIPPETCRAVPEINELCNVASCWKYIRLWCCHYQYSCE